MGSKRSKLPKNLFYDGFNSKLIDTAHFEGDLEIPRLPRQNGVRIPKIAIPFSQRKRIEDTKNTMLVFYEHDYLFRDLVSVPQNFDEELKDYEIVSTPDCSLYRDMPLWAQLANIAISRAIGYYWSRQGKYVIPNVRWGDERTYTTTLYSIPPAFAGIPQNSVVSIGTYGCSRRREDKHYFASGLEAMLRVLRPKAVIVYGSYNPKIFGKYESDTEFYHLPNWTRYIHDKQASNGNE